MPEWVVAVAVALISASGGWLSATFAARQAQAQATQALIDQIQEERTVAVKQADAERQMYSEKLDKMWADKAASREHVAALREHIWQRNDPPPPPPPAGYIP